MMLLAGFQIRGEKRALLWRLMRGGRCVHAKGVGYLLFLRGTEGAAIPDGWYGGIDTVMVVYRFIQQ